MKNILVICPTERDYRELGALDSDEFHIIFDEFSALATDESLYTNQHDCQEIDIEYVIEQIKKRYHKITIHGVCSSDDYPGSIIASILARDWKLPTPDPYAVLLCQHKYYSRIAQQRHVWQAVPQFALVDPANMNAREIAGFELPFFLKPVKSKLSINANQVNSFYELDKLLDHSMMPAPFLSPFNQFIKMLTPWKLSGSSLLIESLLQGHQCTLEGYVFNGSISFVGIVDSHMYPGTICFSRFEFPSRLPEHIQERMKYFASKFMKGIGYDNGFFNIEFMYDPILDGVFIIEVNPRLCSQFADLYEKVCGQNTYRQLMNICSGQRPIEVDNKGTCAIACSIPLRVFTDCFVKSMPTLDRLQEISEQLPDVRIEVTAQAGKKLSDIKQDGKSFRYAIVNIGGVDRNDLEYKLDKCKELMAFEFESVGSNSNAV